MGSSALAPAPTSEILWSVRRPPPAGVLILAWLLAVGFALGGAWLLRSLMIEPVAWWIALSVGGALGLLIPMGVAHGASARVHADGELVYGYGRHPNTLVSLADVTAWRMVEEGLVRGIGIELVRPERVRFLHRKGLSYATMRRYRRTCDVDLVLEFLTAEDLDRLRELQARLVG